MPRIFEKKEAPASIKAKPGGLARMRGDDSGYTCVCGRAHKYPAYVYAHWADELTHLCECGRVAKIKNGVAR